MEIIKKLFDDDSMIIGLCQLKNSYKIRKTVFNTINNSYSNKIFAKSYVENILLS